MTELFCRAVLAMLKKFSSNFSCKKPDCGNCGGLKRPGLWARLCFRCSRSLWQLFGLSTLLLFGYVMWQPCAYLLAGLFLQVLGLMVWLQSSRI